MKRYLKYHYHGYGITRRAQSIPLATGRDLHEGLAPIMQHVVDTDQLPSDELVREGIATALANYDHAVEARGFRNLGADESVELIAAEQRALVEGLIWIYVLDVLPWWHEQFRTLHVEQEFPVVLGCTCGLGDSIGSLSDHDVRDCTGIGWQTRPDAIGQKRSAGTYAYLEFKTSGSLGEWWGAQWEDKIQFLAGVLGAEAMLGAPIDESWVVGLSKGRREGLWNPETGKKDGDAIQQSVLCYGYYRPAKPPLLPEAWFPRYNYIGEDHKRHRVTKDCLRLAIWHADFEREPEMSPIEYWVKWIGRAERSKEVAWAGPFYRNHEMLAQFLLELNASEAQWQDAIGVIDDHLLAHPPEDPTSLALIARYIQRTWSCNRFGRKYACEFRPVCFKQVGWEDPLATNQFIPRVPHHADELAQARAYGELPDEALMDDQEEGEE